MLLTDTYKQMTRHINYTKSNWTRVHDSEYQKNTEDKLSTEYKQGIQKSRIECLKVFFELVVKGSIRQPVLNLLE